MQTELEVKFLNVNPQQLRKSLRQIGASLIAPERLMRRRNFDYEDLRLAKGKNAWVRVRDEVDRITMSYKQVNDYTIHGTQEVNLTVDDFDAATEFLKTLSLVETSYQETRRESWKIGSTQIEIDTWPWLPTFVELEGESEVALAKIAGELGFNWTHHQAGDVSSVYQVYYDVKEEEIIHCSTYFGDTPKWLADRKRKTPLK